MAGTHCGEAHGEVITRLRAVETMATDTERELRDHERNGGTGHVSRGEFDRLATDVAGIKATLIKVGLALALLCGGSSALGPTIAKLLTGG